VLQPRETRFHLIRALRQLAGKHQSVLPKKYGNLPL
jgi:hypothetical protein